MPLTRRVGCGQHSCHIPFALLRIIKGKEEMEMPERIKALIFNYVQKVKEIYGLHLKSAILYGSYARGDFTPESDLDIMILVDLSDDEMDQYSDALSELNYEYCVSHDIWIMPVVKNLQHFQYWVSVYPFYKNVQKEGVIVYEAA